MALAALASGFAGVAATARAASATATGSPHFTLVWAHVLDDPGAPIAESSPVVATLDGGGPAAVVGDRSGYLYAYHLDDGSPVGGWPASDGGAPIDSTPSVASLGPDAHGLDSVFVASGDARHPKEGGYESFGPDGAPQWLTPGEKDAGVQASLTFGKLQGRPDVFAGTLGHLAFALNAFSGSILPRWPAYTADTIFSTAALADLYGSGQQELVEGGSSTAGSAFGVPYQNGGHLRILNAEGQLIYDYDTDQEVDSSPAVGPFLPGGATGIVAGTGQYYPDANDTSQVLAFNDRLVPAWSQALQGCTGSSPALVEISGQLDVAEGTDEGPANCGGTDAGSVYLLDGETGAVIWHQPARSRVIGSVVAADLTPTGQPDLLVPTTHGVEILTSGGQKLAVLARGLGFQNSPLVTDDPNGTIGITIAGYNGANRGVIQHYEIPGSDGAAVGPAASPAPGTWPMFHHDSFLHGASGPLAGGGTATPADLQAAAGDSTITLSWSAPAGATPTGYNVYEGTSPGVWGTPVDGQWAPVNGTTPVTGTTYTVGGLSDGTRYYFLVTAENAAGEGSPSNEASAVPRAVQAPLTITSTSGGYGTPLALTTSGGSDHGKVTYTVAVPGSADCSVAAGVLNAAAAGTCTVGATMAGSRYYDPVSSPPAAVTVRRATTATVLAVSARVTTFGRETEVAVIRVSSPVGVPTGTAGIVGTRCQTVLTEATAECSFSSRAFRVGTHRLVARYAPSRDFGGSRSSPVEVVVKRPAHRHHRHHR